MKTPTQNAIQYSPGIVPVEAAALPSFLMQELERISSTFRLLADGHVEETHTAPDKPRTGDIRLADGSDWNPGDGKGLYVYFDSAWHNTTSDGSGVVLSVYDSAPSPVPGMVVIADGVNWNPGGGQGVYCYYNSAWNKIG